MPNFLVHFRPAMLGLALMSALPLGCDSNVKQEGELGEGTFIYTCARPSDAQCDEGDEVVADEALGHLAVQGVFGLSYYEAIADSSYSGIGNQTSDRLKVEGQLAYTGPQVLITPLKPGWASVFGASGSSMDFLNMRVFEPEGLRISRAEVGGVFSGSFGAGSISVKVAELMTLRVAPTNAAGEVLAGAFDCLWTSSNPVVAEITTDPTNNVIEIQLNQSGTSSFQVTLGALTETVEIVVGGP